MTTLGNDVVNESYNKTIDKLLESVLQLEEKARANKLKDVDINVTINVGLLTIGINKKIGNE